MAATSEDEEETIENNECGTIWASDVNEKGNHILSYRYPLPY